MRSTPQTPRRWFLPLLLLFPLVLLLSGCSAKTPVSGPQAAQPPVPGKPGDVWTDSGFDPEDTTGDAAAVLPPAQEPPADAMERESEFGPPEEAVEVVEEDVEGEDDEPVDPAAESPRDELAETPPPELSPSEIVEERTKVEEAEVTYDIPMSYNDKVLGWVDHFSNRSPSKFLPGLVRSGKYLPMIQRIFREEGLPQDLAYMAHVESAYKPHAYSKAHAKGIFQFISATGRRYGLKIDSWVDERSDPEKATRAAAAYLKDLHGMFGDWYLAMAAYNAGEGKIQRGLARTGAKDFWALAGTKQIRTETKNYVPAILAATLISKDPKTYGFDFVPDPPLEYETIEVNGGYDLRVVAKCAGTDFETIKELNPQFRHLQTHPHATSLVKVPPGSGETTLVALAAVPKQERILYARHTVRRGDTLGKIAGKYHTSVKAIQRANGMKGTMLRVGQTLKIPNSAYAADVIAAGATPAPEARTASASSQATKSGSAIVHRVRRGDTLSGIARRYGSSVAAIAAANGFSPTKTLHVGDRVKVYPGVRSATIARKQAEVAAPAPRPPAAAASQNRSHSSVKKTDDGFLTHTVKLGETLWGIATRYSLTVAELCKLNNLSLQAVLRPGMKLIVPA